VSTEPVPLDDQEAVDAFVAGLDSDKLAGEVQDAVDRAYDEQVQRMLNIDDLSGLYVGDELWSTQTGQRVATGVKPDGRYLGAPNRLPGLVQGLRTLGRSTYSAHPVKIPFAPFRH